MSRLIKRPLANHALRADDCRRHPGVWIEIGSYRSNISARGICNMIRKGLRTPYYLPAGSFEARTKLVDDGTVVYARYVGGAQ